MDLPSPRLSLRIAFSGHRNDHLLSLGSDLDLVKSQCGKALDLLDGCFQSICMSLGESCEFLNNSHSAKIRFSASLANGGDMLAVSEAIKRGYDLHFFLPFPEKQFVVEQGFSQPEIRNFHSFWAPKAGDAASLTEATRTEIDLGKNSAPGAAYESCGNLMLDHADALIVLWDGQSDNGSGGTRAIMREAQRRQMLTVRISTEGSIGVWIPNKDATDLSVDGVFSDEIKASAENETNLKPVLIRELSRVFLPILHEKDNNFAAVRHVSEGPLKLFWSGIDWLSANCSRVIPVGTPALLDPVVQLRTFKGRELPSWTVFSAWVMLLSLFGVQKIKSPVLHLTEKQDVSWSMLTEHGKIAGGKKFGRSIVNAFFPIWRKADGLAVYFSHVFRTAYILSFFLSVLAVSCGLLIVFETNNVEVYGIKGRLVLFELSFLFLLLLLVLLGFRHRWKERWIIHRNAAEAIRASKLYLLLGSAPISLQRAHNSSAYEEWLQWYAKMCQRAIVPPTGLIGPEQLKAAIEYSIDHELAPQIEYHQRNAGRLIALDHRMHLIASALIVVTILSGSAYLVLLFSGFEEYYKPLKPHVTFIGGVLPVCGAAINGIRATGDFRTTADQSMRTVNELGEIVLHLEAERARREPRRPHVHALFDRAQISMSRNLDFWSLIYRQRNLGPGVG